MDSIVAFFSELISKAYWCHDVYPWLFYTYITVIGLMVGSFLNVVIYRLPIMMENEFKADYEEYFHPEKEQPKKEKFNLMVPRSHCPNCGHKISAWENIPLLSFIFLGGKCKQCKSPISIRYPLVEAFTAIMTLVVALYTPVVNNHVDLIWMSGAILLTWALIAISGIDFDKQLIPDEIIFPMMWLGLLLNLRNTYVPIEQAIGGAVVGYLVLYVFCLLFKIITGKEGMGHGDFKLVACLGAWLGIKMLFIIIVGGAFIGCIFGFLAFIREKESRMFCFGPALAIAGFIGLLWGHDIIAWYLNFISNRG